MSSFRRSGDGATASAASCALPVEEKSNSASKPTRTGEEIIGQDSQRKVLRQFAAFNKTGKHTKIRPFYPKT
jgi:hypothetical protein